MPNPYTPSTTFNNLSGSNALSLFDTEFTNISTGLVTVQTVVGGLTLSTLVSGDILYATGASALARLAKGTNGQVLTLAAGLPSWATATTPIFTKSFTSTDQTITAAGSLTLAHGLGVAPKFVYLRLVCQTGEFNYTAGDVLEPYALTDNSAAGGRTVSIVADATNLNLRYGGDVNTFGSIDKTSGARSLLTNANWKLRVSAYA